MTTTKRIRIRRTHETAADIAKKSFSPKWEAFDNVRVAYDEKNPNIVPDIFTILRVIVDAGAEEKAKAGRVPGEDHRYVVRSMLSGRETLLAQSALDEIDFKYARFLVSFYKGNLAKMQSALGAALGEDDEDDHGYDLDAMFDSPVRKTNVREEADYEDECDACDDDNDAYIPARRGRVA